MMVEPHLVDAVTSFDSSALHTTFEMAAIQGRTCVDDFGWWCTIQNSVQGAIEGLHGFIYNTLGIKENSWGISIILFTAVIPLVAVSVLPVALRVGTPALIALSVRWRYLFHTTTRRN